MVRRKVKREIKQVFFRILIVSMVVNALVLLVLSIKNLPPLLRVGSEQKNSIIKPVSELATRNDLSKVLSDRNFIMETLIEGSSSGIIIGQIKDGPKVYFSKNKEARWQIVSLELILNKLTIDNKKPTLIDLRFEQPIVKF
ncbi:MAG: hypothetical protein HY427_00935 [Candidatus Levybacteria bacterium]|nr:hypothetical protein [Candidatus Levybacteria bacterium]